MNEYERAFMADCWPFYPYLKVADKGAAERWRRHIRNSKRWRDWEREAIGKCARRYYDDLERKRQKEKE